MRKKFGHEADFIYKRARNIKPRQGHYIKHYLFCDGTSDSFYPINIADAEAKFSEYIETGYYGADYYCLEAQQFTILKRIDLKFPKQLKGYDKKSYKIFIKDLKAYLFNVEKISEKRAIEFFENDENFII